MHNCAKQKFLNGELESMWKVPVTGPEGDSITLQSIEAKTLPFIGRVVEVTRHGRSIFIPWDLLFSDRPKFLDNQKIMKRKKRVYEMLWCLFETELQKRKRAVSLSRQHFTLANQSAGYVYETAVSGKVYLYREPRPNGYIRFTVAHAPREHIFYTLLWINRFQPIWVELYADNQFCDYLFLDSKSPVCPEMKLVHYLEQRYLMPPTLSAMKKEYANGTSAQKTA